MSSYDRMMEDYDYHQNTGELPEYFEDDKGRKKRNDKNKGGNDGNGYTRLGCIVILVAIMLFAFYMIVSCLRQNDEPSNHSDDALSGGETTERPKHEEEELIYATPIHVPDYDIQETKVESQEKVVGNEENVQPLKTMKKLSKYYEEGYDRGYDDGEDDAVMDNGWGGQFDDENPYTGQKKKDYELGYEEGYEAGYYDNKEGDE